MIVNCLICKEEFYAKPSHINKGYAKTCSRECNGITKRSRVKVSCCICKIQFERCLSRVHNVNYCSRNCKEKDQCIGGSLTLPHYKTGAGAYRKRAFRHYDKKCSLCDYSEDERMLDVHHKDGNRKNGSICNLEVLCVWCHALYTRKIIGRVV